MVKRINYFDGQFLRATDFTEEQSYHIGMRRKHNSLLHTPGIAEGLVPSKASDGATQVRVSPGFAIDKDGNEIQLDVPALSEDLKPLEGKWAFITIAWHEEDSDPTTETGGAGVTRKALKPIVRVSPDEPKTGELVIGKVKVGVNGRVDEIDTSASLRPIAGGKGGNLEAVSLKLTGLNIPADMQPSLSVSTKGQVDLKGSLKIDASLTVGKSAAFSGDLTVAGRVGIGTEKPVTRLHVHGNYLNDGTGGFMLDAADSADPEQYALRINPFALGNGQVGYQFQTKSQAGGTQIPLTFDHAGKVGIGTAAPGEKLDVVGSVRATGAGNWANGFYAKSAAGGVATLRVAPVDTYGKTEAGFTGTDTDIPFVIRANAAPVATFLTNGRVGIGTTAPLSMLHISGNNGAITVNKNGQILDDGNFHIHSTEGPIWLNAMDGNFVRLNTQSDGGVLLTKMGGRGKVGIGTEAPADQLHVHRGDDSGWSGRGVFSGQSNAAVIGTYNGKAIVGAHVAALNAWNTLHVNNDGNTGGGTTIMGIGGNVGIGTASPAEKLHVNGNVQISGRLRDQKIRAVAASTEQISTTSQQWVQMPGMNIDRISPPIKAWFQILVVVNGVQGGPSNQVAAYFRLMVDSKEQDLTRHEFNHAGWELRTVALSRLLELDAGVHTIHVEWMTNTGQKLTACWYNDTRQIQVIEL